MLVTDWFWLLKEFGDKGNTSNQVYWLLWDLKILVCTYDGVVKGGWDLTK